MKIERNLTTTNLLLRIPSYLLVLHRFSEPACVINSSLQQLHTISFANLGVFLDDRAIGRFPTSGGAHHQLGVSRHRNGQGLRVSNFHYVGNHDEILAVTGSILHSGSPNKIFT